LGYTRGLVEDDEIGGFEIPAGSEVFISPYVTHRHPEFWTNPEVFDPENFGAQALERHKFAFLPFGGGMRKCIGYQVALLVMRVLVATVAQHLDLLLPPGHPIVRGALISLRPLKGILVTTKRRDRSRVTGPVRSVSSSSQVDLAEYRSQADAG
jgi:cytochrome P450